MFIFACGNFWTLPPLKAKEGEQLLRGAALYQMILVEGDINIDQIS